MISGIPHRVRIGVFDSGIGGLTVLSALRRAWPGHSTVYLGDTARVPYGTKSGATVVRYARQNAKYLLGEGIELLVVACNTASAYALETLQADLPIPVVGVIEPGARAAVGGGAEAQGPQGPKGPQRPIQPVGSIAPVSAPVVTDAPRHIGVIGTAATIASGAYERAIRRLAPSARISARACPLFVPLVEEGWESTHVARSVVLQYLGDWVVRPDPEMVGEGDSDVPEALVLGCTHYPMLKPMLGEVLGPAIRLVDSAEATARAVAPYLAAAREEKTPTQRLIVTDGAPGFARVAARLLGERPVALEVVDLPFARVE
jgi:glutamate racemase